MKSRYFKSYDKFSTENTSKHSKFVCVREHWKTRPMANKLGVYEKREWRRVKTLVAKKTENQF